MSITKTTRDNAVILLIGNHPRVSVERANALHGQASTQRCMDAGLVVRHPEWSGTLMLTSAGDVRLDALMREEDR